ncbi:MAG: hypothetical protein KQA41_02595 [Candidatus Aenigmarchaeota archaeon]|nr:hypothetical protein [Candidatus Aenigmarchaeota archaeon]MBU5689089.1 hypothetical protein [Candidatus Aenigmarchaeota archaeon]
MKKIIILALILMLPLVQAGADISVKTAYTNPYPVEPGKNFVLGIEVSNIGDEEAKNLFVGLSPSSPFAVIDKPSDIITSLSPSGVRIIEYKMFVDSSAVSSIYQIPVNIRYSGSNDITRNVLVRVQGKPNIGYVDIPSFSISPGETKSMQVEIKNLGSGTAKRVIATLTPLTDNIKVVFSGGNSFLDEIQPNNKKNAVFKIYASPDTSYGVYDAIIKVVYEDESGNIQTKNFSVGIFVTGKPNIKIIKVSTDVSKNELKVDVVNDGNAEARAIKGELMIGESIIDVDYISKINAQKSSTLKFDIPQTKDNKADIKISYVGADNEEYSFKQTISWVNQPKINWLLVAIVIIVIYIILKNYGKNIIGAFKKSRK